MNFILPRREILDLITSKLLDDDIENLYIQFIKNLNCKYQSRKEGFLFSNKSCFQIKKLNLAKAGLTGIDLPIVINKSSGEKTLMILAQDPLRHRNDFSNINDIVIGTPFALHSNFYTKNGWGKLYWDLVNELANKFHNIYITDKSKVWTENGSALKTINTHSIKFLEAEINLVNPDAILALGKTAIGALEKIGVPANKIINTPHPSAPTKFWLKFGAKDGKHHSIKNKIIETVDKFLSD